MADYHEKYSTLFEELRDPVFLLDSRRAIEHVNHAATELLKKLAVTEGAGKIPVWLHEDMQRLAAAGPPYAIEQRTFDTCDGRRHFEIECEAVSDGPGEFRGAVIILHDITELREAEQEARYRSRFSQLVSEMSARFIGIEPNEFDTALTQSLGVIGDFAHAADAFVVQFDPRSDRVALTHWWTSRAQPAPSVGLEALKPARVRAWRAHISELDIMVSSVADLAEDGELRDPLIECLGVPCAVGVPLVFHNSAIGCLGLTSVDADLPWSSETLEVLRVAGQVFTNAIQQRRFEKALDQERNLLRTLIDTLPDYIFAKDEGSRFILNNKAHLRLLRASRHEEVYGKTDHDVFPGELADLYLKDEQAVMKSGLPLVNREETVISEEGERLCLLTTKVPLLNAEGQPTGIVGVGRDITTRKRLAEELESHARLLEQANADLSMRNQELDEFTYIASHDLQEPLRKLISFSDVLAEDLQAGDMDGVRRALKTISSAAKRMKTLVEDLLALSRSGRQSMHWEDVDLAECMAMALDVLELRIAEEKAEIEPRPLPTVYGDRNLLAQLFQNLFSNALKFHGDAPPWITLTVEPDGTDWIIGVLDNGIGIKPEYMEQIFAPFKRLHGRGKYEGTGIGLAICRKIVERHEGRIWVESAPVEGAHFRFVLRARREETAR